MDQEGGRDKQPATKGMKNTLSSIWRPVKGMYVKVLTPNLFQFHFFHELDLQRVDVIRGGPWTLTSVISLAPLLKWTRGILMVNGRSMPESGYRWM